MKHYCIKQNSKSLKKEFQNRRIVKRLEENTNSGYLDGRIISYCFFVVFCIFSKFLQQAQLYTTNIYFTEQEPELS